MHKDNRKWAIDNLKFLARYVRFSAFIRKNIFLIHISFLIHFYMKRPYIWYIETSFSASSFSVNLALVWLWYYSSKTSLSATIALL